MTPTRWAIAAAVIGLMLSVWFWNELPKPYELPSPLTPGESREIERAKKRHGKEIRIRVEVGRIYFVRDGREILIAMRTP